MPWFDANPILNIRTSKFIKFYFIQIKLYHISESLGKVWSLIMKDLSILRFQGLSKIFKKKF